MIPIIPGKVYCHWNVGWGWDEELHWGEPWLVISKLISIKNPNNVTIKYLNAKGQLETCIFFDKESVFITEWNNEGFNLDEGRIESLRVNGLTT